MLSREEALLFQAVKDEKEQQQAMQAAGLMAGVGGAAVGANVGRLPHATGQMLNKMFGRKANGLKPGFRMAGGLVGLILGGGLGAGTAALLKQGGNAGELLGKIQATGGQLSELDEMRLAQELGKIYQSPSDFM